MYRLLLCVWCVLMMFSGSAVARQDEKPQSKPPATPRPDAKQETVKAATPATSEQSSRHTGQLVNVRLEVTITDQRSNGQPTTKTVALVLADRAGGRIRTSGEVRVARGTIPGGAPAYETRMVVLNIDGHAEVMRDNRVRAQVTLEYKPVAGEAENVEQALTTISEMFAVILEDGKPLVVSQSADPTTDRRVRVEVKATILR